MAKIRLVSEDVTFFEGIPDGNWDAHIARLQGSPLQSRGWGMFQQHLGNRAVFLGDNDWAWLAFRRAAKGFRYLYAPYGPATRDEQALRPALASLADAARAVGVDFARFEPSCQTTDHVLRGLGATPTGDVQPRHTLRLGLEQSEDNLHSGVSQSNRNLINTAARRGITVTATTQPSPEEIAGFLAMMADTTRMNNFRAHPDGYYRNIINVLGRQNLAVLYLAYARNQLVAGAIMLDFAGIRYYAHAAAFQVLNRQYKVSAPLLWRAIIDAKRQGMQWFDFWGVADSGSPDHPWAGLTRFKQSFGGQPHSYGGTWDIPVHKLKYRTYRLAKRILGA